MKPLISVIIPVYNSEKTIGRTLKSVLSQNYDNMEIICVNDGSSDSSANAIFEISQKYPNVKLINKPNEGVTRARLDGVKAAKGEYIGFIDSDDLIDPDMYERLCKNAIIYNADISHCGYRLVKPNSIQFFYNTGNLLVQNKYQGLSDLLKGEKIEPGLWNKLYRKELFQSLLDNNSIMDYSIKNNEDLLMNYILFSNSEKSIFEDFCPYEYIVQENSASKGSINEHKLMDPAKASKIIFNNCEKSLKSIAADLYITKLIRAATYYKKDAKNIKTFRSSAQKELRAFVKTYISYDTNLKRKILAVFAAFSPRIYCLIHRLYLR